MTDQTEVLTASDVQDAQITFATNIPAGADPAASGAVDAPVGYHIFDITDFEIHPGHEWTRKSETYIAHQLRPQLTIPAGQPFAGARQIDFIPMPAAGQNVHVTMMNQWYNLLKAAGFEPPKGASAPEGFHPKKFIGVRVCCQVVLDVDRDKNVKLRDDGQPRTKIRFFGYHAAARHAELAAGQAKTAQNAAKPNGAKPAPPTGINL